MKLPRRGVLAGGLQRGLQPFKAIAVAADPSIFAELTGKTERADRTLIALATGGTAVLV